MSNPAKPFEHIEQNTQIITHFDRKVAVTVAIIAALLAMIHSFETEAQAESLKFEIEAGKEQTKAANAWSYYQSKYTRNNMYESMEELSGIVPALDAATRQKATERWQKQRDVYQSELSENMNEARTREKKSEELHHRSETHHQVANRTNRATLLLELAIVITSLAVLTRRRSFWLLGSILAAIGAIYGGYVLSVHFLAGH